ncbi:MAG: LPS export ABC transporter periplasmic protein LptC [Bacteroidetes bacterium]|nr:LPS export ABC transporter periplasmic protein LptC [Bacteroidota bacterium]
MLAIISAESTGHDTQGTLLRLGHVHDTMRIPGTVIWSVLLVIGLACVLGCGERESPVSVASLRAEEDPDQESWNLELFISEEGLPRIHMRARYLARYERPDSTYMILSGTEDGVVRVYVDLFDAEGDSSAVVVSDRLIYYDREKRFVARGNVVVTTRDSSRLESEHLAWSEKDHKVRTAGFVRYLTPNQLVTGYEFEANEDLTEFKISRGKAIFTPEQ